MREAMKRTAVAAHQMGKWGPWIHCTNSVPVPVFGWGFITMDMEGRYGRTDFQTRYPEGYILAQTTGIQCGTVPTALNGIKGPRPRREWRDEFNRLVRTQFATLIPYEIRIWGASTRRAREVMYTFGYGLDDCRVIRFWDTKNPVTVRGPDNRILVCLRNGKALAIVSDFGGGGRYDMTFDPTILGVPVAAKAVDGETGEAVRRLGPGRFAFDIAKHDFKVVVIQ